MSTELARRTFLSIAGAGLVLSPSLALAAQSDPSVQGGVRRAVQARALRDRAAYREFRAPQAAELANGDEQLYPSFIGNFTKGLPHNSIGEVDRAAYRTLLAGLAAGTGQAIDQVPLGGNQKLWNPLSGEAFDLEGCDIQKLAAPPAPPLSGPARAAEAAEVYWMALCRDIPFAAYATDPLIARAAAELSSLPDFAGPRDASGRVTPSLLFRGFTAGDRIGPYVSQLFLVPGNYGAYSLDGRITSFAPGSDHLTDPASWLACQNGQGPFPRPTFAAEPRFLAAGRDPAAFVHSDQACEAFYNAGLRLYALNAPPNPGNPYLHLSKQMPFATFGVAHFLILQAEAALRALKAVFYQKWFVHRTLRPEEFGGLLQATLTGRAAYPLDPSILRSEAAARTFQRFGSFLLPQAFPEGCPQHPSYVQAHSGIAGACATILKAAFDASTPWLSLAPSLQQAAPDGLSLENYLGADASAATVGTEIDKLASNVPLARNFAGVHWRSDYERGLLLGEAMALTVLADQRRLYAEDFTGFVITKFDGTTITV